MWPTIIAVVVVESSTWSVWAFYKTWTVPNLVGKAWDLNYTLTLLTYTCIDEEQKWPTNLNNAMPDVIFLCLLELLTYAWGDSLETF